MLSLQTGDVCTEMSIKGVCVCERERERERERECVCVFVYVGLSTFMFLCVALCDREYVLHVSEYVVGSLDAW